MYSNLESVRVSKKEAVNGWVVREEEGEAESEAWS